jgi:hypothetical protein
VPAIVPKAEENGSRERVLTKAELRQLPVPPDNVSTLVLPNNAHCMRCWLRA